jgi:transcriptional regulator with XRE-family HTH domain
MAELLEDIGHNIRGLREQKGWNQTELGFHADTSPSIISLIENGKRNPSTATLAKIARALGVEVVDLFPKPQAPQPSLEDAAQSDALQEALAVLFQGLARRGQGIIEQSLREGPSEALSRELNEYYSEVAALHRLKGRRDIFGRDSDELAEAEAAYEEVESRIQAMLGQDIDATEEERNVASRFKDNTNGYEMEEPKADAS